MKLNVGRVVSVIDGRTLKVEVVRNVRVPKVNKVITRSRLFMVHTDRDDWRVGEEIGLRSIAKVSKRKAHLAVKIRG